MKFHWPRVNRYYGLAMPLNKNGLRKSEIEGRDTNHFPVLPYNLLIG